MRLSASFLKWWFKDSIILSHTCNLNYDGFLSGSYLLRNLFVCLIYLTLNTICCKELFHKLSSVEITGNNNQLKSGSQVIIHLSHFDKQSRDSPNTRHMTDEWQVISCLSYIREGNIWDQKIVSTLNLAPEIGPILVNSGYFPFLFVGFLLPPGGHFCISKS